MNWSLSEKLILAEVFFNDYFLPMILANCRCHTALSAFSMPNEASLDHNWHSWKIHRQTCFPIIFNCQTFCTNKCCCTLRNRRAQAGCAMFPSWLHLKRLEHGAGSSPSCCCLWCIKRAHQLKLLGSLFRFLPLFDLDCGEKLLLFQRGWMDGSVSPCVRRRWRTRSVCSQPTQIHMQQAKRDLCI